MADKTYSAEYRIKGNAADALKQIETSAKGARQELDKGGEAADSQSGKMGKLDKALGAVKASYAAVAAAVVLVVKRMFDAAKAYGTQAAQLGRLNKSLNDAGASFEQMRSVQKTVRDASNELGIELIKAQKAAQLLAEASGDATMAERDFKLALDISAASGRDLEEVSKDLSDARRGEFDVLKRYAGFNKDVVDQLRETEDSARATDEAFRKLTTTYEGSASALKGTEEALASTATRLENIETNLGGILANMTELAIEGGSSGGLLDFLDEGTVRIKEMYEVANILRRDTSGTFAPIIQSAREAIKNGEDVSEVFNRVTDQVLKFQSLNLPQSLDDVPQVGEGEGEFVGPAPLSPEAEMRARIEARRRRERERKEEEAERKRAAEERAREQARKQQEQEREAAAMQERIAAQLEEADAEVKKEQALERQQEIRERIADLQLQGRDFEAFQLELEQKSLTPAERRLELLQKMQEIRERNLNLAEDEADKEAAIAKAKQKETQAVVEASGRAASGIIGALSESDEAKMASAALDAAVYGYKAIVAFIEQDPAAGIGYLTAATQAVAVAAGSRGGGGASGAGGKGGGGAAASGNRAQVDPEATARRQARLFAEEFNREQSRGNVTYNINVRSVAKPDEAEARVIGEAVNRNTQTLVGGAGRTLNVGG